MKLISIEVEKKEFVYTISIIINQYINIIYIYIKI